MCVISPDNNQHKEEYMRYKSVHDWQMRDRIWFVIKYRDMLCIFITVPMWSLHDRLLLTVTHSSLAVEQDLVTESYNVISGLDCKNWRICLELINITIDLSECMYIKIWLCSHNLSTCDKSLVSDVITTSKHLLWVDRVVSSANISARECDRTEDKSLM